MFLSELICTFSLCLWLCGSAPHCWTAPAPARGAPRSNRFERAGPIEPNSLCFFFLLFFYFITLMTLAKVQLHINAIRAGASSDRLSATLRKNPCLWNQFNSLGFIKLLAQSQSQGKIGTGRRLWSYRFISRALSLSSRCPLALFFFISLRPLSLGNFLVIFFFLSSVCPCILDMPLDLPRTFYSSISLSSLSLFFFYFSHYFCLSPHSFCPPLPAASTTSATRLLSPSLYLSLPPSLLSSHFHLKPSDTTRNCADQNTKE